MCGLGSSGLRCGETTVTAGRTLLPDGVDGATAVRAGPGEADCGVGVPAAGAAPGGSCGGVCAQAPAQTDDIRKDVDASKCGRNDMNSPCPEG